MQKPYGYADPMAEVTVSGLRVIHEIALSGSFTAAARLLGYSQPAISRQVAAMEAAAGYPLFIREHFFHDSKQFRLPDKFHQPSPLSRGSPRNSVPSGRAIRSGNIRSRSQNLRERRIRVDHPLVRAHHRHSFRHAFQNCACAAVLFRQ